MFLDQGYEAVSLDTVIARVGGSRRNIYDNFGGKEGLFIEVVTQLCEDLAAPLENLEICGADLKGALALFGRKILEIVMQPRAIALHRLMIAEGQRFPAIAQSIWHAGQMNATRLLACWVEAKQAEGHLRRDVSAQDLASSFISLTVSVPQLRGLVGLASVPQTIEIENAVDVAVSLFLDGASLMAEGRTNA